jgi:hypothetical protein
MLCPVSAAAARFCGDKTHLLTAVLPWSKVYIGADDLVDAPNSAMMLGRRDAPLKIYCVPIMNEDGMPNPCGHHDCIAVLFQPG